MLASSPAAAPEPSGAAGTSGNSTDGAGNSTGTFDIPAAGLAEIVAAYNLSTDVEAAAYWFANPVDTSPTGDIVLTVRLSVLVAYSGGRMLVQMLHSRMLFFA